MLRVVCARSRACACVVMLFVLQVLARGALCADHDPVDQGIVSASRISNSVSFGNGMRVSYPNLYSVSDFRTPLPPPVKP